jgi:hypothetical protein
MMEFDNHDTRTAYALGMHVAMYTTDVEGFTREQLKKDWDSFTASGTWLRVAGFLRQIARQTVNNEKLLAELRELRAQVEHENLADSDWKPVHSVKDMLSNIVAPAWTAEDEAKMMDSLRRLAEGGDDVMARYLWMGMQEATQS